MAVGRIPGVHPVSKHAVNRRLAPQVQLESPGEPCGPELPDAEQFSDGT